MTVETKSTGIIALAKDLIAWRVNEKARLDLIHAYLRGRQDHPSIPRGVPDDVRRLARISQVNVMKIVVNSVTQCLFVDGYRQRLESADAPAWDEWRSNKMAREQIGVHRAALTYGVAYATVLPGVSSDDTSSPVIRGYSPRKMTALYDPDDPDWPVAALSAEPGKEKWTYRLYDDQNVHVIEGPPEEGGDKADLKIVETREHGIGVTPVIRFMNEQDLDSNNDGEVEPLMHLQDQINLTTFGLLVSQHYAAFRQRYIIGWTAESETQLLKAGASRLMTFGDAPEDVKVGEFAETELTGYLKSREESLKQAATLSQTPVHELIGSLVNLSAEALVAAEAGQRRKIVERQTSFGESWEMVLELVAGVAGQAIDTSAQVRWRDTESRAFSATVDALGKLVTMMGVPAQALWEQIPNVSQADVDRWKKAVEEGGELAKLNELLGRQTTPTPISGAAA